MPFEYDPAKSAANKAKHGLDFEAAQALWDDGRAVTIQARLHGEVRWMSIGRINGWIWAAVDVYRAGHIRLVSVRRARRGEVDIYERGGV